MRSLFDNIVAGGNLAVVHTTTTTSSGAVVDTMGYSTGVLSAVCGLNTAADVPSQVFSLLECDTSGGNFTAALATDGNAIGFTLTGNGSGGAVKSNMVRIEGLGQNRKRYLKIQVIDTLTGSSSVPIAAQILLGRSHKFPTQTGSNDY